MRRVSGRLAPALFWCLIVALAGGSVAGIAGLAAQERDAFSPARGNAQVIAQGIAPLPEGETVWRVAAHALAAGEPAPPGERAAGFVVGDGGALLVTDRPERRALLVPGEAAFVYPGSDGARRALGERPAAYFTIELVPAPGDGPGEGQAGEPVFRSAPFAVPPGERDLNLVRGVLAPDETTTVIGGEAPTLVLATLGRLQVEGTDGSSAPLAEGAAGVFGGDVIVRGQGETPSAFVAAVIGDPIEGDGAAATPRATVAPPALTPAASPVAATEGAGSASLAVVAYVCPPGVAAADANEKRCSPAPRAIDLSLVAVTEVGARDLGAPGVGLGDGAPTWLGLEAGGYILQARGFAAGLDRFVVPAQAGRPASPEEGYAASPDEGYPVTLDDAESLRLAVFALGGGTGGPIEAPAVATATLVRSSAVAAPQRGSIGARVFACPASTIESLDPAACAPAPEPYDLELSGEPLDTPLTLADARVNGEGVAVWRDLPFGQFVLRVPLLPAGTASYYVPGSAAVGLLADGTGYAIAIDPDAPTTVVDVFTLAFAPPPPPLPTPVPVAPTPVPAVPVAAPPAPADVGSAQAAAPPTGPVDSDGDSLTDDFEASIGTNPNVWDGDGDGLSDGEEYFGGTDPFSAGGTTAPAPDGAPAPAPPEAAVDSDGDGVLDVTEAEVGSDPFNPDSDGDGATDAAELSAGTSPLDPASRP